MIMKNPAYLISIVLALVSLIFVCLSVNTRYASQIPSTPAPTVEITMAPTPTIEPTIEPAHAY